MKSLIVFSGMLLLNCSVIPAFAMSDECWKRCDSMFDSCTSPCGASKSGMSIISADQQNRMAYCIGERRCYPNLDQCRANCK